VLGITRSSRFVIELVIDVRNRLVYLVENIKSRDFNAGVGKECFPDDLAGFFEKVSLISLLP
jgi:hypothetical protein